MTSLVSTIIVAAHMFSVPPALLLSICSAESDLRPRTNVQDGGSASYGVCQIKLATARMFEPAANPALLNNSEVNARLAAQYVRYQMARYPDDLECVIAAYNSGTCRRNKHGKIMNRKYVKRVKARLEQYEADLGRQSSN